MRGGGDVIREGLIVRVDCKGEQCEGMWCKEPGLGVDSDGGEGDWVEST